MAHVQLKYSSIYIYSVHSEIKEILDTYMYMYM